MSRQSMLVPCADGYAIPYRSLFRRLKAKFAELVPYQDFYGNHADLRYYARTISKPGDLDHDRTRGPYDFKHWISLADMLNVWTLAERDLQPKYVRNSQFQVVQQEPLPGHLRFPVVTPALQDAITQIRARGWVVSIPPGDSDSFVQPPETRQEAHEQALAADKVRRAAGLPVTSQSTSTVTALPVPAVRKPVREAFETEEAFTDALVKYCWYSKHKIGGYNDL